LIPAGEEAGENWHHAEKLMEKAAQYRAITRQILDLDTANRILRVTADLEEDEMQRAGSKGSS